jgi:hypothetical protein
MARAAVLVALLLVCGRGAAEPPTVVSRPTYLRSDAGFGAPTGLLGFSAGHAVAPPWAIEAGAGLGASGLQLALLGRWYAPVGRSRVSSWALAAGPSLSLIGRPIGFHVPHAPEVEVGEGGLYFIAGLNAEAGWELRLGWGGLLRVAIGGFLRVAENMSGLCPRSASGARDGPCGSPHLPTAPEIARLRGYPYLTFGYGWAF